MRDPQRPQRRDQGELQTPPRREEGIRGRKVQRHCGGPPRRILRRTAGDLPQRQGREGPLRQDQEMLVIPLHRPRHLLQGNPGLLPRGCEAGRRRPEDGQLRVRRHHVHRRPPQRCQEHHRGGRIRPRRSDGRRRGHPRYIPGRQEQDGHHQQEDLQTDLEIHPRTSGRSGQEGHPRGHARSRRSPTTAFSRSPRSEGRSRSTTTSPWTWSGA